MNTSHDYMKKEIKEKFPEWCNNTNTKYNLMLSDDLDSLFSCVILNKLFNYEIGWFYDFDNMYIAGDTDNKIKSVAVDADLVNNRRCWGNHVTLQNPKAGNLNTIMHIGQSNYFKKYAGSTLLTILSYYNVNINNLTEEQKMVLLSVDSTFLMYRNINFRYIAKYWMVDVLEYIELYNVLEKHTQQEFVDIIKEYGLDRKIWADNNGQLNTNIELDKLGELFPNLSFNLPKNKFNTYKSFKIVQSSYLKHSKEKIFSCARTYKNAFRYSIE